MSRLVKTYLSNYYFLAHQTKYIFWVIKSIQNKYCVEEIRKFKINPIALVSIGMYMLLTAEREGARERAEDIQMDDP